jgi:hypothetical protein
MHDDNASMVYAAVSGYVSLIFGLEQSIAMSVFFGGLAGSFLSVRFCEPKTTLHQAWQVFLSTILACMVTGGIGLLYKTAPLQAIAIFVGLLILLVAEKIYITTKEISLKELFDRWIKRWIQ